MGQIDVHLAACTLRLNFIIYLLVYGVAFGSSGWLVRCVSCRNHTVKSVCHALTKRVSYVTYQRWKFTHRYCAGVNSISVFDGVYSLQDVNNG